MAKHDGRAVMVALYLAVAAFWVGGGVLFHWVMLGSQVTIWSAEGFIFILVWPFLVTAFVVSCLLICFMLLLTVWTISDLIDETGV